MIKPEQRTHEIVGYVTKTYKKVVQLEAKKRGISVSAMINTALFDFLNPKILGKSSGILRIDRSKKGSDIPIRQSVYRDVMKELKEYFKKKLEEENDEEKKIFIRNIKQ